MAEGEFAEQLRTHLGSVWALEILLLLRGAARPWTVAEVVKELRATTALVQSNLERLERSGFVVSDEERRFCYRPVLPILESFCDDVAQAYREKPVSVINLISAPESAVQRLADAFRFGGKPK